MTDSDHRRPDEAAYAERLLDALDQIPDHRVADRIAEVAVDTAAPAGSLWWLSFADPSRPSGWQFLGACLVEAPNLPAAVTTSHMLGINPGGAVAVAGPIPPDQRPAGYPLNRLLSRADVEELDRGSHDRS